MASHPENCLSWPEMNDLEICTHRLVLPVDANHYGTLYAGALLRIALEAAYASAYRLVGKDANLVLRRVLNLECYYPVPVGTVIEIRGTCLYAQRAHLIIGLRGTPLADHDRPWMDGLMEFVQVDHDGRPQPFTEPPTTESPGEPRWQPLHERMTRLLAVR